MIHIVLFEPEIPQNTGNIGRTVAATDGKLHLIKPIGFSLDEKSVRRAALDYWEHLNLETHESYEEFLKKEEPINIYYISRYANKTYSDIDFSNESEDVYIVFGCESKGLPKKVLAENFENTFRIPMNDKVRSLNLSNCATLLMYEALRQQQFKSLLQEDVFRGNDWIFE